MKTNATRRGMMIICLRINMLTMASVQCTVETRIANQIRSQPLPTTLVGLVMTHINSILSTVLVGSLVLECVIIGIGFCAPPVSQENICGRVIH